MMWYTYTYYHDQINRHIYHRAFKVNNTMLLTIITMLYIRSVEFICLITESLYPLSNIFPFPDPTCWVTPGSHLLITLCFCKFDFLDYTHNRDHMVFVFL